MSYQYEGQTFETLAAFQRAFPIYRAYTDLIKAGVNNRIDLERAIAVRHGNARKVSIGAARRQNTKFITGRGARK
jgi:hypothetical protein